ncbi:hypothetical protein BH20ACI2_BH20ACI2_23380 [soil metagenome]
MVQKHYKKKLSAFIDHELSTDEQHAIGAHLMKCGDCRREHDRIKLGAQLAQRMERSDAGPNVWGEIEDRLDGRRAPQISLIPRPPQFGPRNWAGYAVAAVMVTALISAAYFALFSPSSYQKRQNRQAQAPTENNVEIAAISGEPGNADNSVLEPDSAMPAETQASGSEAAWEFETISGSPSVGAGLGKDRLAVGDFMETDAASRARISVADIGSVEIAPNSRVKLVGTAANEHRLSLERGALHARILAPPRLFIVDTPSAVAVDLGCEYKLEVDKAGNSFLHVTSGFVALERDGRESIVPAGAMCMTKKGRGLGTPFSAETSKAFRTALERFDFASGGSRAVQAMLDNRGFYDMVTLWHLLSRVQKADREKVYAALAGYVEPPSGVTRDGILSLDKKMLASWRAEVESAWFE